MLSITGLHPTVKAKEEREQLVQRIDFLESRVDEINRIVARLLQEVPDEDAANRLSAEMKEEEE